MLVINKIFQPTVRHSNCSWLCDVLIESALSCCPLLSLIKQFHAQHGVLLTPQYHAHSWVSFAFEENTCKIKSAKYCSRSTVEEVLFKKYCALVKSTAKMLPILCALLNDVCLVLAYFRSAVYEKSVNVVQNHPFMWNIYKGDTASN